MEKAATKKSTARKAPAQKKANTGPILKVVGQPEKPYRKDSARDKWWQAVQKYDGKPEAEFRKYVAANHPSQPKNGKLKGQLEPPTGWLKFFQKAGVLRLG